MNSTKKGNIDFSINWKLALRHLPRFLKDLYPFILSHHPDCEYFKDHYFTIRGVKFCIGCFTAYPTFLIVFTLGFFTGIFNTLSFQLSVITTIVLVIPYIIYRFERFHHSKKFNIFSKACFGTGFAILFLAILNLPLPSLFAWIIIILLGGFVSNLVNSLRVIKMEQVCKSCPMYKDFPLCDGFKVVANKLERDGFLKFSLDKKLVENGEGE